MSIEARNRIESHSLLREEEIPAHTVRVDSARLDISLQKQKAKKKVHRRIMVHIVVFIVSFIFTSGVSLLGILLWVRPDTLLALVLVSVFSGAIFVISFASLRMFILHHFLHEYENEEDPGTFHHISKSVSYALVALVLAIVLVGMCINVASAGIV
jgi:ABC-type Fe3+ transport system permease subunit